MVIGGRSGILSPSRLAIYNEGVVPLIRKRRMLKRWPSEGDAEEEEEEEGSNKEGSSAIVGLNTDSIISENKEHIQQSDTQNEITTVHIQGNWKKHREPVNQSNRKRTHQHKSSWKQGVKFGNKSRPQQVKLM